MDITVYFSCADSLLSRRSPIPLGVATTLLSDFVGFQVDSGFPSRTRDLVSVADSVFVPIVAIVTLVADYGDSDVIVQDYVQV